VRYETAFKPDKNERQIALIFRADDSRGPINEWTFQAQDAGGFGSGAAVLQNGKQLENWWAQLINVNSRSTKLDVEIGLPLNEWRLLDTWGPNGGPNDNQMTRDRDYQVVPGTPAIDRFHMLIVPVTYTLPDIMNWSIRLFAVRADGQRIAGNRSSGRLIDKACVTQFAFEPGKIKKPEDVVRYEFEATPLTLIDIRNVAAMAGRGTDPEMRVIPAHASWKEETPTN
jgi:hypothetical protein